MEQGYKKLRSRTFWLAAVWSAFVPLGLGASVYLGSVGQEAGFVSALITQSGIVVAAYVGGNKLVSSVREKRHE